MNTNYPQSTVDGDENFVHHAMKSIFTKKEMKECAKQKSLLALQEKERMFVKGNLDNFFR